MYIYIYIYIYGWFISIDEHCSSMAYASCMNNAYLTHIFSLKAHHSLLVHRSTGQHISSTLEGQFKQQNHQQNAQKCEKKMALNRLLKQ